MKKIILIAFLYILPFIVFAQSIKYSGIDEFTGKPVIHTSWVGFGSNTLLPKQNKLNVDIMLRYENENVYLHLKFNNRVNSITKGSELQLKMSDNSIITLHATNDFSAKVDVYTNLEKTHNNNIIHAVYEGDISTFANDILINKIRINSIYGAIILAVDTSNAQRIAKAYKLMMDEREK